MVHAGIATCIALRRAGGLGRAGVARFARCGAGAGLLLLLWVGPPGCAPEAPPGDDTPRFARSFLPVGSDWIPESEIPSEPQQTPKMVIWELSSWPDGDASPAQQRAADELVERSLAAAERNGWFEFQRGVADGYKLLLGDKRHYYNEAYVFDDRVLDPDRPEFLMYYGTPQGQKLAGIMFYTASPLERGPQIGGPLTVWHYHVWSQRMCLLRGLLSVATADDTGACERGIPTHRSPEMLHVWFLEHPDGAFATSMWLKPAQLRALIERDQERATR